MLINNTITLAVLVGINFYCFKYLGQSVTSNITTLSSSVAPPNIRPIPGPEASPNRYSTFRISPDLLYVGSMENGLPSGVGRIIQISSSSLIYEGEVKNGIYEGKGKRYVLGVLYESGIFSHGKISMGVRYNTNGSVYSGYFQNDEYSGNGRLVLPCGFFITGTFPIGLSHLFASIPDARSRQEIRFVINPNAFLKDDCIAILDPMSTGMYLFYYNGDVFCGKTNNEIPVDGILYKYVPNRGEFRKIPIGTGKVFTEYKCPVMIVNKECNCLSFSFLTTLQYLCLEQTLYSVVVAVLYT